MIDIIINIKEFLESLGYECEFTGSLAEDFTQDFASIDDKAIVIVPTNVKLKVGNNNNVTNSYARGFDLPILILNGKLLDSSLTDEEKTELILERMREVDVIYNNIAKELQDNQNTLGQCFLKQNDDEIYHQLENDYQSGAMMSFNVEYQI